MRPLIVIGGGEFSRVVIETARASMQWDILGFLDPRPCDDTVQRLGVRYLGDDRRRFDYSPAKFVLGVGTTTVSASREQIVMSLNIPSERWACVVHPSAIVSTSANIKSGAVVLAGSVICSGAEIGEHAIINIGACIDHDVKIGKFVHVAPKATLGGGSIVEDHAYIGIAAVVRDHVTIRHHTLVGMGAVVTRQYDAEATLVGVPARPHTVNSESDRKTL